jgi:hypothetical protein
VRSSVHATLTFPDPHARRSGCCAAEAPPRRCSARSASATSASCTWTPRRTACSGPTSVTIVDEGLEGVGPHGKVGTAIACVRTLQDRGGHASWPPSGHPQFHPPPVAPVVPLAHRKPLRWRRAAGRASDAGVERASPQAQVATWSRKNVSSSATICSKPAPV